MKKSGILFLHLSFWSLIALMLASIFIPSYLENTAKLATEKRFKMATEKRIKLTT